MSKTDTSHHDEQIANMAFGSVYPHHLSRLIKNGRTKEEYNQVITWLTGYDDAQIQSHIDNKTNYKDFFEAAQLHPNANMITGVVCGYRIEGITNDTTRNCRYLDKLVDELARGRKMEKILRTA
ncbi:MAG: DUF2200 domain-containing protein [Gilvibacter sp.]